MDRYADTSTFSSSLKILGEDDLFHVGHSLDVKSGNKYGDGRRPHRAVLAVLNRKVEKHRPSIA